MGDIMKYAVDRIENNIVVLENINNNSIREVNINELPNNIKEGTILKYYNKKYIIDTKEEENRRERIQEKLERLKRIKKGE